MSRNITDLGSFAVKNDGSEDFKKFVLEPLNVNRMERGIHLPLDEYSWEFDEYSWEFDEYSWEYYGIVNDGTQIITLTAYDRNIREYNIRILTVQQVKDYLLSGVRPGEEKKEERIVMPTDSQIDAVIKEQIGKMWGGLEMASIEYFIQTGTVNGAFYERISNAIRDTFHLVRIKTRMEQLKQFHSPSKELYERILDIDGFAHYRRIEPTPPVSGEPGGLQDELWKEVTIIAARFFNEQSEYIHLDDELKSKFNISRKQ